MTVGLWKKAVHVIKGKYKFEVPIERREYELEVCIDRQSIPKKVQVVDYFGSSFTTLSSPSANPGAFAYGDSQVAAP